MGFLSMLFETPKLSVEPSYKTRKTQKRAQRKPKDPKPAKGTKTYYLEIVTESKKGLALKRVKIIVPKSASSFWITKARDNYVLLTGYSIPYRKIPDKEWSQWHIGTEIDTKGTIIAARLLTSTNRVIQTSYVLDACKTIAFKNAKTAGRIRVVNLNAQHKFVRITI